MKLKECPCGKVPTELNIERQESTAGKWGYVSGGCCDWWQIEFRLQYDKVDSEEAKKRASITWNNAPRKAYKEESK